MRKADIVLAGLAVLALVLTGVAVAKSDAWTGERTYTFASSYDQVIPDQAPIPAGSAPARFEIAVPDNATGIMATILVNYEAQAVQGGTAIIRISGTAPDGTQLPVQTRTLAMGTGTSGGEGKLYNATWAETPSSVRDTREPAARHWDQPLVILVTVEGPNDPLGTYSFEAGVSGRFVTYAAT